MLHTLTHEQDSQYLRRVRHRIMTHKTVPNNHDCSFESLDWPSRHAAMSLVSPMKQHMSLMRMLLSATPSNLRLLDKDMSDKDHLNRDELHLTRGIATVITQHNSRDSFEMPLGDKDHAPFSQVRHESRGPILNSCRVHTRAPHAIITPRCLQSGRPTGRKSSEF